MERAGSSHRHNSRHSLLRQTSCSTWNGARSTQRGLEEQRGRRTGIARRVGEGYEGQEGLGLQGGLGGQGWSEELGGSGGSGGLGGGTWVGRGRWARRARRGRDVGSWVKRGPLGPGGAGRRARMGHGQRWAKCGKGLAMKATGTWQAGERCKRGKDGRWTGGSMDGREMDGRGGKR